MTCLHELVEEQVARTPQAIAVIADDVRLTYLELEERANRLANGLIAQGVGPESVVGVRLHRSVDLVVALLAVVKAGAAYLPLDPDYPADRLEYMTADSGAQIVLTDCTLGEGQSSSLVARSVDESNPAYMIYTSGSTGRPKGVVVDHRGIVNRIRWMQDTYHLDSDDRVIQKTPYSFDVSVWEFFWTLSTGATLVMAKPGGHRDPGYLVELITSERITTVHFVPSMLRAFLAEPFDALPSLRRVLCSGEALPADLATTFFKRVDCELHNLYGPTEASVDVTATPCHVGEPVTIGWPITNVRIHIVDENLHAAEEGQLCIAGVQLARGYHGRPGLTAEKFVPDPFAVEPGGRLYLTGDLARRGPDGAIEYLGRLDHQVKIRGHRVELGEIEAALMEHPAIQAAVVTGSDELVAYVVGSIPDVGSLRSFLGKTLPEHMIPSLWVSLDELPLTSSGKIDRKALPEPDGRRPALAVDYVAPRNDNEAYLTEIWESVLGVRPIGVHDAFLDLGGQSLSATQICARVGRQISPSDLFTANTIEALAQLITPGDRDTITASGSTELSAAQQRMWFLDQLNPGSAMYTMHEAYECEGDLDIKALQSALDKAVQRHATLRTTFQSQRGRPQQVVAENLSVPVEVVTGEDALNFVHEQAHRPFSLSEGPLLRLSVLRTGHRRFVLLAVVHHIISDDWSMAVFWRDLCAFYVGDDLPALPIQYTDYAAWQRKSVPDSSYWLRHLEGAPLTLDLPTTRPRPPRQRQLGGEIEFPLPAGVADFARAQGVTTFMALLSGFTRLIAARTGRDDLVVATFSGNRPRVELEDLIGLFVNTLALRIRTGSDLLAEVRSVTLDSFRHQDLPFDQLVTALRPPRDLSRNPVAQVAFQLLGPLTDRVRLAGVRSTPFASGQGGSPFDLMLTVRECPDGLTGYLHYDEYLFDRSAVWEFAEQYVDIMEGCMS